MNKQDKMQMLPTLLAESSWNSARMLWLKRRDKIFWFFVAALISFFVLWTYIGNWQSSSLWQRVFAVIYVPVVLWAMLAAVRSDSRGWTQVRTGMLALRQATEEKDEQIAPLVASQPAALTAADFPTGQERISLFGGWFSSAGRVASIGVTLLLFCAGYVFLLVTLIESHLLDHPNTAPLIILLISVILIGLAAVVCGIGGIIALLSVYSMRRHAYIIADEAGMRWWRRAWGKRSRASISWYDARSFFMIVYPGKEERRKYRLYALDAHDVLLLWHISHRTRPRVLAAHERFCRLIVTRTKLPLRDLSAAVEKLVSIDEPSTDEQPLPLAAIPARRAEDD